MAKKVLVAGRLEIDFTYRMEVDDDECLEDFQPVLDADEIVYSGNIVGEDLVVHSVTELK